MGEKFIGKYTITIVIIRLNIDNSSVYLFIKTLSEAIKYPK